MLEPESSRRPLVGESSSGNPANIQLENVRLLWLDGGPRGIPSRYLILEDMETGDVLLPLIYMRSILEANYSRKLAALKYREVNIPEDNMLKSKQGLLHWHWAFECPPPVKILVKAHLNESKAQGHMRLVLMPIVYNAMGDRANLRAHPLFVAMDREIRRSTYWPLVSHPPPVDGEGVVGDDRGSPLFSGPKNLSATTAKYMFLFPNLEEVEHSKKLRTTFVDTMKMLPAAPDQGYVSYPTEEGPSFLSAGDEGDHTPEDLAGAKGLFDMLISGTRERERDTRERERKTRPPPMATYGQAAGLQRSVAQLQNDMTVVKASVVSMAQMLTTLLHRFDTGLPPRIHRPTGD